MYSRDGTPAHRWVALRPKRPCSHSGVQCTQHSLAALPANGPDCALTCQVSNSLQPPLVAEGRGQAGHWWSDAIATVTTVSKDICSCATRPRPSLAKGRHTAARVAPVQDCPALACRRPVASRRLVTWNLTPLMWCIAGGLAACTS